MKDIKVLLFDLGGVIIDIDPSITINALKSMSKKSSEDLNALDYKYYKEESSLLNFFFEYEKGNINDDKFRNGISCLLYTSPSPRDLSTSRMPSSA